MSIFRDYNDHVSTRIHCATSRADMAAQGERAQEVATQVAAFEEAGGAVQKLKPGESSRRPSQAAHGFNLSRSKSSKGKS